MDIFLFYFEAAIPYKRIKLRERKNNRRLSKSLINSSKKMKMLNNMKRRFTLTSEVLGYTKKYQSIYKRVLKEAKKRDNDRYVTEAANKTKAMWQLINRKIGKIQEDDHKLELRLGNIIKNPIEITEKLHMYFTNTVTQLVQKILTQGVIVIIMHVK